MKNIKWFVLVLAAVMTGIMISGCQQATETPSILQITSVSPTLDAADIPSTEALSITFNYPIKTIAMTKANLFTEYAEFISGSHNAGTPEVTELKWSNENRTMTLSVNGWSNLGKGSGNNRVAIRATNRIEDIFGDTLGTEAVMWRFRLRFSQPKADAPTFVLSSGTYEANTLLVTIEAPDADEIYYTTDGTDPTAMTVSSTLYTGPVTLENSAVVKAIAVQTGHADSDVSSAWYDLWWWQALGSGFGTLDEVYAMAYDPDRGILYAAGRLTSAGGVPVNNIAQWDGSAWSAVDSGVESTAEVSALLYANGDLYVGGDFLTAGGTTVNGIARWDGSSWSPLGSGVSGGSDMVFALAFDSSSNDLIAGGDYTSPANYIAKWNGSSWSAFSTEPNNRVKNLAFDPTNNILYAGGWFNNIGKNLVAQWNGTSWSALGDGIDKSGVPANLNALAAGDGNLYAGGDFDTAGTTTVSNIAMWNGTTWSGMDGGMNDTVYFLIYDSARNFLYAGGDFTSPANYIARWDGTEWGSFGGSYNGTFIAPLTLDPEGGIYVVGDFTQIGGISAAGVARWGKK